MLDHPHIVPIYEVGEHDGQHYFSMKLIEGGTLTDRVQTLLGDPRAAVKMIAGVAGAVHAAHQRGILHRDLKPGNILLDADGSPHVADFGLAKREETDTGLTATGQIVGTPNYMSPEQARGRTKELTTAADIYSLGAILYELITGHPPFQAESVIETLRQVTDAEPQRPRIVNPAVDRDLETIALKCLEKEPGRRYGSAEALAEDLELWLRGVPISARPVGGIERAVKWARRRPAIALMSSAVVVTVLAALAIVTWQWRDAIIAREAAVDATGEKDAALQQAQRDRDKARVAREETLDVLARGLFDQAHAVRLARGGGHRWKALELLKRAEQQRGRKRSAGAPAARDSLPSRAALRSEAIAAMQSADGRVVKSWPGKFQAISSGERYLAIGDIDSRTQQPKTGVRLYDLNFGREVSLKSDPRMFSSALAIAPDGRAMANAATDAVEIRLWAVPSGKLTRRLNWPNTEAKPAGKAAYRGNVQRVRFSPDGRYLSAKLFGGEGIQIALWDLGRPDSSGKVLATVRQAPLAELTFGFRGKIAACVSGQREVTLWKFDPVETLRKIKLPIELMGPVGLSRDGQTLVASGISPETKTSVILFWDLGAGKEKLRLPTQMAVWASPLAFSPDGRRLAVATMRGTISIFRLDTATEEFRLDHGSMVSLLRFSRDGRHLFSGGMGSFKKWELSLRSPVSRLALQMRPNEMLSRFAFSRDGKWIAIAVSQIVRICERTTGQIMHSLNAGRAGFALKFTHDSRQLLIGASNGVSMYDVETGHVVDRMRADPRKGLTYSAVGIAADGRILVSGSKSTHPAVWDFKTKKQIWEVNRQVGERTSQLIISPDGSRAAIRRTMLRPKRKTVVQGGIEIWDVAAKRLLRRLPRVRSLYLAAFGPHGRSFVTVSQKDMLADLLGSSATPARGLLQKISEAGNEMTVRVADVESGKTKCEFHGGRVISRAFSPDGRLLAVRFRNHTIQLWDVVRGEHLFDWRIPSSKKALLLSGRIGFTPDGAALTVLTDSSGPIQLVDLKAVQTELAKIGLGW